MEISKGNNPIPKTLDLRDRLKLLLDRELECLPDLLEGLEGKERLDAILKLMPLVLPKAKPVNHWVSEDDTNTWRQFG